MKNYYALTPGEFFVAEEIAKRRKELVLCLPLKDKGVDLFAVDETHRTIRRIQVKESRTHQAQGKLPPATWHRMGVTRIDAADVFVFVCYDIVLCEGGKPKLVKRFLVVPQVHLKRRCAQKKANSDGTYDFFFHFDGTAVEDVREPRGRRIDFSEFVSAWHLL